MFLQAMLGKLAGRRWPAGHTLDTPDLKDSHVKCGWLDLTVKERLKRPATSQICECLKNKPQLEEHKTTVGFVNKCGFGGGREGAEGEAVLRMWNFRC
jgi:hypothetical protein